MECQHPRERFGRFAAGTDETDLSDQHVALDRAAEQGAVRDRERADTDTRSRRQPLGRVVEVEERDMPQAECVGVAAEFFDVSDRLVLVVD